MLSRDWQSQAVEIIDDAIDDKDFMSALIARMPVYSKPFNLIFPSSKCPHCKAPIRPWHNIPILGYFLIRGHCADCQAPISARYPLIEMVFHFGTRDVQNSIMSVMIRIDGTGG